MKKSLLIATSLLTLGVVTGIYAQTTGTTSSLIDKMKAVAHSFTLATTLNPSDTGLTSDPVKGKKTGDILTAGEWNRMLELVREGGGGSTGGDGSIKARITYRNLGGTVTTIGSAYGVQSVTNGSGITNFNAYNTIITLNEPLLASNYAVIVNASQNDGSARYEGNVLDWVCMWNKIANNKIGIQCTYPGYGTYGNSIVSVVVIGDGGSGVAGLSLYKCTNAQSLDTANAPCYSASRNTGAGTDQYRVVSCTVDDGARTYTAASILNFNNLVANKWAISVNGGTLQCVDGSVLVAKIQ